MAGFVAYLLRSPAARLRQTGTICTLLENIAVTEPCLLRIEFVASELEHWFNERFFRLFVHDTIGFRQNMQSRHDIVATQEAIGEQELHTQGPSHGIPESHVAYHAYLADVEADYEAASNMMEQRHETEVLNLGDDHQAELAEVETKYRVQLPKHRARFTEAQALSTKKHQETVELRSRLQEVRLMYDFQTRVVRNY